MELAKELRDKQRNAFAQTFSEAGETKMNKLGYHSEAEWCSTIRGFNMAVNDAAVSTNQRLQWLLDMRDKLLMNMSLGHYHLLGVMSQGSQVFNMKGSWAT